MKLADSSNRIHLLRDQRKLINEISYIEEHLKNVADKDINQHACILKEFVLFLEKHSAAAFRTFQIIYSLMEVTMIASKAKEYTLLKEAINFCEQEYANILSSVATSLDDFRLIRGCLKKQNTALIFLEYQKQIDRQSFNYSNLFFQEAIDAVDICENIFKGNIVFLDEFLSITWFSTSPELNKRFEVRGETVIAVKTINNNWTFDKYTNNKKVPIATLKRAKKACQSWDKGKLFGQITHHESARIASFLGFEIIGDKAYLKPRQKVNKGFIR